MFHTELLHACSQWPLLFDEPLDVELGQKWLSEAGYVACAGSGCSKVTARLCEALLREEGRPAFFVPAFSFISNPPKNGVVILASASFSHEDARQQAEVALKNGNKVIVIAAHPSSEARDFLSSRGNRAILLSPLCAIDEGGFAPVLSAMAQLTIALRLLVRRENLSKIGGASFAAGKFLSGVSKDWSPWLQDDVAVHLLTSGSSLPAATDLETRLLEAGICPVVEHDLIDFCHGRFVEVAGRKDASLLVAFADRSNETALNKCIGCLDKDVKVVIFESSYSGVDAMMNHVFAAWFFVDEISRLKGIDPAKPKLPDWADKIYRIRSFPPSQALVG